MKEPLVSVIIPVYNSESSVIKTLDSVRNQSYKNIEIIVVDDGSTDSTLKLVKSVGLEDSRVSVISKKNGGPSSARNVGLGTVKGKYIAFVDADDFLLPNAIETYVKNIHDASADLVVAGWQTNKYVKGSLVENSMSIIPGRKVVSGSQEIIKTQVMKSIGSTGEMYNLWNKLFVTEIIKRTGIKFREDLRFGEDLVFILDYVKHASSISFLDKIAYVYISGSATSLFGSSSLSLEYREKNAEELESFAGDKQSDELRDLTAWVQWRWLLSFSILVQKSTLSKKEKVAKLQGFPKVGLKYISSPKHIGLTKYFIYLATRLSYKLPSLFRTLTKLASMVK